MMRIVTMILVLCMTATPADAFHLKHAVKHAIFLPAELVRVLIFCMIGSDKCQ